MLVEDSIDVFLSRLKHSRGGKHAATQVHNVGTERMQRGGIEFIVATGGRRAFHEIASKDNTCRVYLVVVRVFGVSGVWCEHAPFVQGAKSQLDPLLVIDGEGLCLVAGSRAAATPARSRDRCGSRSARRLHFGRELLVLDPGTRAGLGRTQLSMEAKGVGG